MWDFLGKAGSQITAFVLSIVLTRLLTPDEYGIMGMAMVIIYFGSVFLDIGFNRALVQQKEVSPLQYSTVFFISLGIGVFLTVLCYSIAGAVADFYKQPQVKPIFRALSFIFLVNAFNTIPTALLTRSMNFRALTIIVISSSILSGVAGIIMAYKGYGVWALVVQTLSYSIGVLIFLNVYVRYLPKLNVSFREIRTMWQFGKQLFASNILDMIFSRVDIFLIGRLFTPAILGYYTRAQSIDNMVKQFSSTSITSVLFPYISKNQDDKDFLTGLYNKYLHIVLLISICLSGMLFLVAPYIFEILFSRRWVYSGELFQIMALGTFIWPVSNLMGIFIIGVGNSKSFLHLEIIKKCVLLPVYIFGFVYGIKMFIAFYVAALYITLVFNSIYVGKVIHVNLLSQLRKILAYMASGIAAAAISYFLCEKMAVANRLFDTFLLSLVFVVLYLLFCALLKLNGIRELMYGIQIIKNKIHDKRYKNISTRV